MSATRRPPVTVAREIRIRVWECACHVDIKVRAHYWSKKRCDTCGTERPEPLQPVSGAHVPGVECGPLSKFQFRAACSCGWRGVWHRTEAETRTGAKVHAEAFR